MDWKHGFEQKEGVVIRPPSPEDTGALLRIYNHYVANTTISFELDPISLEEMDRRISKVMERHGWLLIEDGTQVLGYAYYSSFRDRPAYKGTVETTIYMNPSSGGKGFGTILYRAILTDALAQGFQEALGVIALPNEASVRLHEKLGFHKVAHLERVGYKMGRWIDVGIWQRHLLAQE